MGYLLPAGSAPRTKNKWGLGFVPIRVGDGIGPVLPGPMPVWPGSGVPRIPIRPIPPIIIRGPITQGPPNPPTPQMPSTAGTPVPAGFPVNQFYVAPDGSVWEYSTSANQWVNTGTPYNVNAPGAGATSPTPAATTDSGASQPPVSVTVSTPAGAPSAYQSILDWLTQSTLISPVPNWIVAGAAYLVGSKMLASQGGRSR